MKLQSKINKIGLGRLAQFFRSEFWTSQAKPLLPAAVCPSPEDAGPRAGTSGGGGGGALVYVCIESTRHHSVCAGIASSSRLVSPRGTWRFLQVLLRCWRCYVFGLWLCLFFPLAESVSESWTCLCQGKPQASKRPIGILTYPDVVQGLSLTGHGPSQEGHGGRRQAPKGLGEGGEHRSPTHHEMLHG